MHLIFPKFSTQGSHSQWKEDHFKKTFLKWSSFLPLRVSGKRIDMFNFFYYFCCYYFIFNDYYYFCALYLLCLLFFSHFKIVMKIVFISVIIVRIVKMIMIPGTTTGIVKRILDIGKETINRASTEIGTWRKIAIGIGKETIVCPTTEIGIRTKIVIEIEKEMIVHLRTEIVELIVIVLAISIEELTKSGIGIGIVTGIEEMKEGWFVSKLNAIRDIFNI